MPDSTSSSILHSATQDEGASFAHRLHLDNIHHHFGKLHVLRGIHLDVAPGEILCLAGPSGCGKSTLLRLIAGLEQVQTGTIRIDGDVVGSGTTHMPPEKREVGMVFQDFALFPHLNIGENIAFGLRTVDRNTRRRTVESMLQRVGLADRAEHSPQILSGGQQQRVALARALAAHPRLMLLDEPFSNLDVQLRQRVRADTQQLLKESGISSVMVTHDPQEAMFMADRIALMNHGRIVQLGTPEEIYSTPVNAFATEFFGDVNRFSAIVRDGAIETPLGRLDACGAGDGSEVEVLVRPEAVTLVDVDDYGDCGDMPTTRVQLHRVRRLGASLQACLRVPDRRNPAALIEVQALLPGNRHYAEGGTVQARLYLDGVFVFRGKN